MSETWKQVVVEKDPSTMTVADVANLGPPPRDRTPQISAYVKRAKPSYAGLCLALAILSVGSYALFLAFSGPFEIGMVVGAWLPALTVVLAVWTRINANKRRATMWLVMRDGGLRFARVVDNRQTRINRGAVAKYRYDAVFDVDGRSVPHSTFNDGMSMLDRGQIVEVVYNPDVPNEIVPTFLLV